LKAHLAAIDKLISELELDPDIHSEPDEITESGPNENTTTTSKLHTLLFHLNLYDIKLNSNTNSKQEENTNQEALAMLQRCFKELCYKYFSVWSSDQAELDRRFCRVYSCFIHDADSTLLSDSEPTKISFLELFAKIHYETDHHLIVTNTFNDFKMPILSMIKSFQKNGNNKLLWRKLFVFCYMEKKILLRSVIVSIPGPSILVYL
jgi:hypothetical protein